MDQFQLKFHSFFQICRALLVCVPVLVAVLDARHVLLASAIDSLSLGQGFLPATFLSIIILLPFESGCCFSFLLFPSFFPF